MRKYKYKNKKLYVGDYDNALNFYNKALDYRLEKYNSPKHNSSYPANRIADIYFKIGEVEDNKQKYDSAINFYEKALIFYQYSYKENHITVAQSYNNIALTYYHKKDIDKAIENISLALDIAKELNDRVLIKKFEKNLKIFSSAKNKQE